MKSESERIRDLTASPGKSAASDAVRHTPGPWTIIPGAGGLYIIAADETPKIFTPIAREVAEEDARLIAAAPALLEALKVIDGHWTEDFPAGPDSEALHFTTRAAWAQLRAAIAKATHPASSSTGTTQDAAGSKPHE